MISDFDLTIQRFGFSSTPGDSLRSYFSSQAAAMKGSQNVAGISDPVIDALIDKIIAADSRKRCRNEPAKRIGAANVILTAVGYNLRLVLVWLRIILRVVLLALLQIFAIQPALKPVS